MNTSCINILMHGPIYYAAFGFWMYSNRQTFENVAYEIKFLYDTPHPEHHIIPSIFRLSPGTPLLLLLVISLLFQLKHIFKTERLCFSKKTWSRLKIKPNEDCFFSTVPQKDKDFLNNLEHYLQENFEMCRIGNDKLQHLMKSK